MENCVSRGGREWRKRWRRRGGGERGGVALHMAFSLQSHCWAICACDTAHLVWLCLQRATNAPAVCGTLDLTARPAMRWGQNVVCTVGTSADRAACGATRKLRCPAGESRLGRLSPAWPTHRASCTSSDLQQHRDIEPRRQVVALAVAALSASPALLSVSGSPGNLHTPAEVCQESRGHPKTMSRRKDSTAGSVASAGSTDVYESAEDRDSLASSSFTGPYCCRRCRSLAACATAVELPLPNPHAPTPGPAAADQPS